MSNTNERLARLVQQLQGDPGIAERLPEREAAIVRGALEGQDVHSIAQEQRMSEPAVWELLSSAARAAAGQPVEQVETGGLGSDTDPGVTGGYGETGFGSLGTEPPLPTPEEPREKH
jgi:hypothetical protein